MSLSTTTQSLEKFIVNFLEMATREKALLVPYAVTAVYLLHSTHMYRYLRKYKLPLVLVVLAYRAGSGFEHSWLALLQRWMSSSSNRTVNLICGDVFGLVLFTGLVHFTQDSLSFNVTNIRKSLLNSLFGLVKDFSFVKNKVDEEKAAMRKSFEHDLKTKTRAMPHPHCILPPKGMAKEEILELMHSLSAAENKGWSEGKLSGGVYHGIHAHQELLNEAFGIYSLANPLHADVWPSSMKYESEIIQMTANLVNNGNRSVVGSMTSGGTESIILAMKTHRDYYREKFNITKPEMIACVSAHAAVDKGCDLLGIKLIKVPMGEDFRMDLAATRRQIGPNTILMYSSAPNYAQGAIDDIAALSALAQQYSIGLHVDCCLGGFVLPFARKLGYPVPAFDFSLPGVSSMSLDTHKYGYALKGTSVVLYRDASLRQHQYFCYADWPGGLYATPTLAGSRSGGMIAQTWASMVALGEEGYLKNVKSIMESARQLREGIKRFPQLKLLGAGQAMVVCFAMKDDNDANAIYALMDLMSKKFQWALSSHQSPPCAHLCVTVCHQDHIDELLNNLDICLQELERDPELKKKGSAAIYGMTSSMPSGPVNDILRVYNDVVLDL